MRRWAQSHGTEDQGAFSLSAFPIFNAARQSAGPWPLANGRPPESPSSSGDVDRPINESVYLWNNGVIQPLFFLARMHHPGRITLRLHRKLGSYRSCSESVTAACVLVGQLTWVEFETGLRKAGSWELFVFSLLLLLPRGSIAQVLVQQLPRSSWQDVIETHANRGSVPGCLCSHICGLCRETDGCGTKQRLQPEVGGKIEEKRHRACEGKSSTSYGESCSHRRSSNSNFSVRKASSESLFATY